MCVCDKHFYFDVWTDKTLQKYQQQWWWRLATCSYGKSNWKCIVGFNVSCVWYYTWRVPWIWKRFQKETWHWGTPWPKSIVPLKEHKRLMSAVKLALNWTLWGTEWMLPASSSANEMMNLWWWLMSPGKEQVFLSPIHTLLSFQVPVDLSSSNAMIRLHDWQTKKHKTRRGTIQHLRKYTYLLYEIWIRRWIESCSQIAEFSCKQKEATTTYLFSYRRK